MIPLAVNTADDELFPAFVAISQEIERIWQEIIHRLGHPTAQRPVWRFNQGRVSFHSEDAPDRKNAAIHRRAEDLLNRSRACQTFADLIEKNLAERSLVPQRGSRTLDRDELLYFLVSTAYPRLTTEGVCPASKTERESSFNTIMDQLFAEAYPVRLVAPLLNFESFAPSLEVTSCVTVSRLGDDEKNDLIARFAAHRQFPDTGISISALAQSNWALELSRSIPRGQAIPFEEMFSEIALALAAIRLMKSGRVGAVAAIVISDQAGHSAHDLPEFVVSPGGGQFRLEENEHAALLAIASALELPESRSLGFALRWFNRAVGARWGEDIITAAAIALEGALLPNETNELSFRLALRGAALAADDGRQEEVFQILRILYSARSKIVHEGCPITKFPKSVIANIRHLEGNPSPEALPEIALNTARDVLRRLVLRLDHGTDRSRFLRDLERQVITSFRGK